MPKKPRSGEIAGQSAQDLSALNEVVAALAPLDAADRQRVLQMVRLYFEGDAPVPRGNVYPSVDTRESHRDPVASSPTKAPAGGEQSPKEFLLEKRPTSDIERVACLAFYLSHYMGQNHFRTRDISALNVEAKQPPFGNAAQALKNALSKGFVVPAGKGARQLSAVGERFVLALPDRDEAVAAFRTLKPKRNKKRG